MKALIIADNDLVIENISSVLKTAGYDTIIYKWLLKALDNIEEITPHLIVISTEEYPRHWKTLTQFSQHNFGDYTPQVILYAGHGFDDEEMQKASALGVRGVFTSVDVEGLDALREILKNKIDIYSGRLTDPEVPQVSTIVEETVIDSPENEEESVFEENIDEEQVSEDITVEEDEIDSHDEVAEEEIGVSDDAIVEESDVLSENTFRICSLVFTNPISGAIVSGYAKNFNGETVEYVVDFEESIKSLSAGTVIPFATIKTDTEIKTVKAEVVSFVENGIRLEIKQST